MIGSYLAHYFTSNVFFISFGLLLISIACLLYWLLKEEDETVCRTDGFPAQYNRLWGIVLSVLVGFLSSTFGIGGGIIHVPAMIAFLGFSTHVATATSHFVLAISTFLGVVSHYFLGNILVGPALIVGSGAAIGAQIGAYVAPRTKARSISLLLCMALLFLGSRMILSNI